MYNELLHHVSIIKMARKDSWIIAFGARTKETTFSGPEPARVGLADDLSNFLKCQSGLHHCVPLIELIEKYIWFA